MEIKEKWTDKDGREFNLFAYLHTKYDVFLYEYMEKHGDKLTYYLATIKDNDEPVIEKYSCNDGNGFKNIDDLIVFKNTMKYVRQLSVDIKLSNTK